jgi:probable phosphoglycerate mutase|tara:strand:+ start:234 stop:815 length:582 start_codon:yes stop_codon:yes gene_type:complete
MKLILTRHGETEENKKGIIMGNTIQGILTPLGIEQAKKLADRLKDEKFDHIYSSPLSRSAKAANMIAEFHKDTPIDFVDELKEIDAGSRAGTLGEKDSNKNLINLAPDAESFESMQQRAKKLIDKVYEKYPDGNILFVAHGHINKIILTVIENKPAEHILKYSNPPNTSISIFEIKEDKNHIVHLLNCTKHLD